jgi:hypothetical protein
MGWRGDSEIKPGALEDKKGIPKEHQYSQEILH